MVKVICFLRMTGIPSICGESPLTYSTERSEGEIIAFLLLDCIGDIREAWNGCVLDMPWRRPAHILVEKRNLV